MKAILVLFALLLSTAEILPQTSNCTIFLNNSKVINGRFIQAARGSLRIAAEKEEGVSYKVIDSVKTTDKEVAAAISATFVTIRIQERKDHFLLDFTHAQLAAYVPEKIFKPFKYETISTGFVNEIYDKFGLQLDVNPWFSKYVLLRFDCSFHLSFDEDIMNYFTVCPGIGVKLPVIKSASGGSLLELDTFLGYNIIGYTLDNLPMSQDIIAISGSAKVFMNDTFPLFFTAGFKLFPAGLKIYEKTTNAGYSAGLGFRL